MVKIGDRVGAISHADKDRVFLFGYGVYAGDEAGGPMDQLMEEPWANPKIQLDDGSVVWGCECWWGPEARIREKIGSREVIMMPSRAVTVSGDQ